MRRSIVPFIVIATALASNAGLLANIIPQCDLLVHFQVQYAWVLAACALWCVLRRRLAWLVLSVAALTLPAARITPWYLPQPVHEHAHTAQPALALLSCNVKFTNTQYPVVLDLILTTDPDVVVVQEATPAWSEALMELGTAYPHQLSHPAGGPRGMVLLSRFPLLHPVVDIHPLTKHCTLSATVEVGTDRVQIIAAHPFRPGLRHGSTVVERELQASAALARGDSSNVVFIGDLNTTMWSGTYQRLVSQHGLTNLRRGRGVLASWRRSIPWLSAIPIDHCLIGCDLRGVSFTLHPVAGSDHDAMHAVVQMMP